MYIYIYRNSGASQRGGREGLPSRAMGHPSSGGGRDAGGWADRAERGTSTAPPPPLSTTALNYFILSLSLSLARSTALNYFISNL